MAGLPSGTLGDAVGVLVYTIVCLLCDLVLIWLLWVHKERFGYLALIAYFAQLCTISSICQQIYHYRNYNDVAWAQLSYIKANYPNAEVIFKNGNFGFMLVLSNIRFFCYIIESTYLLTYTFHIAMSIYGVWAYHRRAERIYGILSKLLPPVLTGMWIALEYTPSVQRSWTLYMIVANLQAVAACTLSIILIVMILWKYVDSKSLWKSIRTGPMLDGSAVSWKAWMLRSWMGRSRDSTPAQTPRARDHVPKALLDNNWLVFRLSIAIILISGFILATVLVHLPTPAQMAREIEADAPDLSSDHARSSIIGYIYGVTPGLAIPIVFGLTRPFRQTMRNKLLPRCFQGRGPGHKQQTSEEYEWGPQVPPAHAPALEASRDSQPCALTTSRQSPDSPVQEWINGLNMKPSTSSDEDIYDLVATTTRPGVGRIESNALGRRFSNSSVSLDSLLEVEYQTNT